MSDHDRTDELALLNDIVTDLGAALAHLGEYQRDLSAFVATSQVHGFDDHYHAYAKGIAKAITRTAEHSVATCIVDLHTVLNKL